MLAIFYFANLHEFLLSGFLYRANWAEPILVLSALSVSAMALRNFRQRTSSLIVGVIGLFLIFQYSQWFSDEEFTLKPDKYLSIFKHEPYRSRAWTKFFP